MTPLTDDAKFRTVIEAAWRDPAYKSRLLADPEKALKEHSIDCPQGCKVSVIESDHGHRYFILPPAPDAGLSAKQVKEKSDTSDYKVLVHVLYNVNCC